MSAKDNKDRLRRLGTHITGTGSGPESGPKPPGHYTDLAAALGAELVPFCGGSVCRVNELYPPGYRHGNVELRLPFEQDHLSMAPFSAKGDEIQVDFGSLLFFDTETTGLGGSGAVAFLVGVGSVTSSGFEVRQYLIPDFSDESAMLEMLLDEFLEDKTLVSFNGKSFDLPLLESRMIINRAARKIAHEHHIDLLHASRRLFKKRLKDCTLVNLEQKLLGFHRSDDIPGYLIPATYFDWIHDRQLGDLKNVLLHNRLDIISLYFLLNILSESYTKQGDNLDSIADLYSLSKLYSRHKLVDRARELCSRIEQESAGHEEEISFYNSLVFKRAGEITEALVIWTTLSKIDSVVGSRACIELSKYLEHTRKNLPDALSLAERALGLAPKKGVSRPQIGHRIDRLKRKLTK